MGYNLIMNFKIVGIVTILVAIFLFVGFKIFFPSCGQYETPLNVPDLMQSSDIVFEKDDMYYVEHLKRGSTKSTDSCKNLRAEAQGVLNESNNRFAPDYPPEDYKVTRVEKGTKFKLIRASKITFNGVNDFEGYKSGDYYLLKNDKGEIYYIRPGRWGEGKTAGYYKNGQRTGDVIIPQD
jgi:hypothetical protein